MRSPSQIRFSANRAGMIVTAAFAVSLIGCHSVSRTFSMRQFFEVRYTTVVTDGKGTAQGFEQMGGALVRAIQQEVKSLWSRKSCGTWFNTAIVICNRQPLPNQYAIALDIDARK